MSMPAQQFIGYKPVLSLATVTLAVNAIFIAVGIAFYVNPAWPYFGGGEYIGEDGPLTLLSFVQLLAVAVVARKIFHARASEVGKITVRHSAYLWALICYAFIFLALDDVGKIHEKLDHVIHKHFIGEETELTDRIDDFIVVLYGLLAVGVMYLYRREVTQFRQALWLLIAAFGFLFTMAAFDAATNGGSFLRSIFDASTARSLYYTLCFAEETCKVLGSAVFLIAFHRILMSVRARQPMFT